MVRLWLLNEAEVRSLSKVQGLKLNAFNHSNQQVIGQNKVFF
jgi:hypothetical protein